MKYFKILLTVFIAVGFTALFAQHGGHNHGGHMNPDSLEVVTKSGFAIVDTNFMHPQYFLDEDNDGTAEYFLNFGPYWYEPDSSNAVRPNDGDAITITGGLWDDSTMMMNEPMIVVYEINGEFWRDPYDPFWNHMGTHSHMNGCGSGFGWMHDSLETVILNGAALVDTTFFHEMYYLDENFDGEPDYFLNFGPYWYEPPSGAVRPENGDTIDIVGGKLDREVMPMVMVYEINGLLWRDSTSFGQHFGGGWIDRNMTQPRQFYTPFDNEDHMIISPGWYQMGGGGHGGHGGMMTDSMFCQLLEILPNGVPNAENQSSFAAYEVDIFQMGGGNGTHHNGNCGGHMHFNSPVQFNFHYSDEQVDGIDENSITAKYWDVQTSTWIEYSGLTLNSSENLVTFSTDDISNFIILTADGVTGVQNTKTLPEEFNLNQNYPNPFNPSTIISFDLPVDSEVELTVFNSIGQEVATLVNRNLSAGYHTIEFDAANLSSGIYFYKLKTENFVQTRKMVLLR